MSICLRTALRTVRPSVLRAAAPAARRNYSSDFTGLTPTPIFHLTETEQMLKESVASFAQNEILPKVREMDEAETMDKGIVSQLFEQGLMGVEIEERYGGSEMNFGSCIVAIEELARVDPSVHALLSLATAYPL